MFLRSMIYASALVVAAGAVQAQDWTVDPAHTSIEFSVNHLGFSTVSGRFDDFTPEVSFDPDDLEATEVTFTIDAASVTTHWDERDEHLRSADFLDVENHPEITFTTTQVTTTGEDTADVTGDLTIRGTTQPVTLAAKVNQIGPNPFDDSKQIAGFTLTGEIDRTQYGIDFGAPAIGAVLPVTVNVELNKG